MQSGCMIVNPTIYDQLFVYKMHEHICVTLYAALPILKIDRLLDVSIASNVEQ